MNDSFAWAPCFRSLPAFLLNCFLASVVTAADAKTENDRFSLDGGFDEGKARVLIEALLKPRGEHKENVVYTTVLEHSVVLSADRSEHAFAFHFQLLNGRAKEITLTLAGPGTLRQVTGPGLQDWSLRQEAGGARSLVLRLKPELTTTNALTVRVMAEQPLPASSEPLRVLTLTPPEPALFSGYVSVQSTREVNVQAANPAELVPVAPAFLPETMRARLGLGENPLLAYRFQGSAYQLPLQLGPADPEARRIVLRDARLEGRIDRENAGFTLSGTARVTDPKGGALRFLSGNVALTDLPAGLGWRVRFENDGYVLGFDRAGEFPIRCHFEAALRQEDGWNQLEFQVAPSALCPVVVHGLADDTRIQLRGAARPERQGNDWVSYLAASGQFGMRWKEAMPELESKLFYSVDALAQISVSPGLMTQMSVFNFKIMQGEFRQIVLELSGKAEVTHVQGEHVLSWSLAPLPGGGRRLAVELNQPQKAAFNLLLQMQTPLSAFPQTIEPTQVRPAEATRYTGYCRVVNQGAVRLEVLQASGLSQIAPELFPETDVTKGLLATNSTQRFAYRFSGTEGGLRILADQIVPEFSVSQLLEYHFGESEQSIEAELELEIREAALRELLLRIPRGYGLARLTVAGLSDSFVRELPGEAEAELRLVYAQPVSGRQLIQARLERNQVFGGTNWLLPRVSVPQAKAMRGQVGISVDSGFRLAAERTRGLTEVASAFFPRKSAGLQSAYRISEADWEARMQVERLPQAVQVDAFHLFSVGEGIAYGSSILNYVVSGSPIAGFRIELSAEYFNIEFTGKDVIHWQKTTNGYEVQLRRPIAGPYTLLASYERPFRAQGETLTFTGARPLDAQPEQGYTVVVSGHQFRVQPADLSPGLLPIEAGEIPAEYRLLFDVPVLAAYRYTARPFQLRLALSPMAQGDSLNQVADRAALHTRISRSGQVLTDVQYLVKSRGAPHFRCGLPAGVELWSATVNGAAIVPVTDGTDHLIPLPQRPDPNAILTIDLQLASATNDTRRIQLLAPRVSMPVLLAEWKIQADTGQSLRFRGGSLRPTSGNVDRSGFAGLARILFGNGGPEAASWLVASLGLCALTMLAWRWATPPGACRFGLRHLTGACLGFLSLGFALTTGTQLERMALRDSTEAPREMTFVAPVQQPNAPLTVEIASLDEKLSWSAAIGLAWPALLGLITWTVTARLPRGATRSAAWLGGWLVLAWAALRWPNGAPLFLGVVSAFLLWRALWPAMARLATVPRMPPSGEPLARPAVAGSSPAALWLLLWIGASCMSFSTLTADELAPPKASTSLISPDRGGGETLATSVTNSLRVEGEFLVGTLQVHWFAAKGDLLPVLFRPAILTGASYQTNSLRLVTSAARDASTHQLLAEESGFLDASFHYQLHLTNRSDGRGFALPTAAGLINEVDLTIPDADVEIVAPNAISIQRRMSGGQTSAKLVLPPSHGTWVGWKARTRDVQHETPVFYADISQLYVPTAGVIEGVHSANIRPAQGELRELTFQVPSGTTITDVKDTKSSPRLDDGVTSTRSEGACLWRFDPDLRQLRVTLASPQSRAFTLLIRSQISTGPFPYEKPVGLISLAGAATQVNRVGFATGSEAQLDDVKTQGLSPLNLEDFPTALMESLQSQILGLTLRRSYRTADHLAQPAIAASAVQPEVRAEARQTLSLADDRTVLAVNLTVAITRAGLFRLSFVLPSGLEVESIAGEAMTHWTQVRTENGPVVTLHLRSNTEGEKQFGLTLVGPGAKPIRGWAIPQFALREAAKQSGTLVVVPEQGLRLQVAAREGLTSLDPEKSGVKEAGVLAYRILQSPWQLTLDIEPVDAWVQVTSLQHVSVTDALMRTAANLHYQIENTGLRLLRVWLPVSAQAVQFQGEHLADFRPTAAQVTNGLQGWEIKLQRRVLGSYPLQVRYQTPLPLEAAQAVVRGIQASDANLQRGFVTLESAGRLQLRIDSIPDALQRTEWQSIPTTLQQNVQASSAHFAYRLIEPSFQLPLKLERHPAAKLLPARVKSVTFTSVIADNGVMLTQARLEVLPNDKRLLALTLPPATRFWFAFVNQAGVWPWREQEQILIPLDSKASATQAISVEFFYSTVVGRIDPQALALQLPAPRFDLPLADITWQIYLNDTWKISDTAGSLQLAEHRRLPPPTAAGLDAYLKQEASARRANSNVAEQMLAFGNTALAQGEPQQARRAFEAAFGLSRGDGAFNEDARAQLNNLKLQQALVALNVRQANVAGEPAALSSRLSQARDTADVRYSQAEAKSLIEKRSSDENAALTRLAQRLIQQQEAAVSSPGVIRATIPEQGQLLAFKRAVVAETWADLNLRLTGHRAQSASWALRGTTLAATLAVFVLFSRMTGGRLAQSRG